MSTYRNPVVPIKDGYAQAVYKHVPDTTSPAIEHYNLDLDSRLLTIQYSEVVNTSHAHASGLSFQGAATGDTSVTLSDDTKTDSENGLTVVFELCDDDFNKLKKVRWVGLHIAHTRSHIARMLLAFTP